MNDEILETMIDLVNRLGAIPATVVAEKHQLEFNQACDAIQARRSAVTFALEWVSIWQFPGSPGRSLVYKPTFSIVAEVASR